MSGSGRDEYNPVGTEVPFDNTDSDLNSENVEDAIKELEDETAVSASPGFTWGRSGNVSNNTWLNNDGVPSNKSGRTVALANPEIQQIFIANEDISTFDLSIYEHEGDEVNLTLLTTVSITSSRSDNFDVSVSMTSGRQLATRVTSGSAKNLVVGVQLKGNTA